MAPTLLAALDAPTAVQPTGRVLHEIVGAGRGAGHARGHDRDPRDGQRERGGVTDTEADEMEEHLRGLGYIE